MGHAATRHLGLHVAGAKKSFSSMVLMAGGVIIFAALAFHVGIAIWGSHRLSEIADRYI